MIPIKYKRRMYLAHQDLWRSLLDKSAPLSDVGRGKTNSSQIPNLGHSELEDVLKAKYKKQHCIFTDCATDGLDLVVRVVGGDSWYVPSYTWYSPVNAIAKAGKEVRFLDVHAQTRMVDYSNYDPDFPIIIPHVDGRACPAPPVRPAFVLEDAAQSPLDPNVGFGDALVLSFGSSKRLGLLGQGGCILTNDEGLAKKLKQMTMFGLDSDQILYGFGDKSFFDPYNSYCTQEILRMYSNGNDLKRIDQIIEFYNASAGVENPLGLERYTIQSRFRNDLRARLDAEGIETRVWIKDHAARHPAFKEAKTLNSDKLEVSDRVCSRSFDLPLNEYLTDAEVEKIGSALRSHQSMILKTEQLITERD